MPESKQKRYNLTRLGEDPSRRVYYRRDAHCPVLMLVRRKGQDHRVRITGWLINISEEGCLTSGDGFPSFLVDAYVIFPGLGSKVLGYIRTQGDFTLQLEFERQLPPGIVTQISRLTLQKADESTA
ncbi:MAG: hypothetical protein CML30_12675 [Rhizobiales bacterium]|nr:hypothetical protein [Hyphomicrobiales bacterium]|tara:strand:- start:430 stop:807 length:378 start_codon:yes stop_codon:yes gene_type:complete